MSDNITNIGLLAFNQCKNLRLSKLPNNLESIGNNGFQDCKNITISILPDSLKSIGNSAFYGCENIDIREFNPPTSLILGESCFEKAGIANINVINIYYGVKCGNKTFLGYGAGRNGLLNAYFETYHPDTTIEIDGVEQFPYGVTSGDMGINGNVDTM